MTQIVTFGAVPTGKLSDDFTDTSANGGGANGVGTKILPSDLVDGKFKLHLMGNKDSSPVYYNDGAKVRIHLLGNKAVEQMLQPGKRFVRMLSIRALSSLNTYAGDEIHAAGNYPLAHGPAPMNGYDISGGQASWLIRGASNPSSPGFVQWCLGQSPRSDNGNDRFSQKWAGLSNQVQVGKTLHTFDIYTFGATSGTGSIERFAAWHGGQMVNIVPLLKIATCFASPITHYPMISVYFERSQGGDHGFEFEGGAYVLIDSPDDLDAAKAFQVEHVGYDLWGGTTPPPPVGGLKKISETASSITLGWDTPDNDPEGYRFYVDGKVVSSTFDGTRRTVKFAKGATEYGVLPLLAGELLTYKP